jgi:hypothetical protein
MVILCVLALKQSTPVTGAGVAGVDCPAGVGVTDAEGEAVGSTVAVGKPPPEAVPGVWLPPRAGGVCFFIFPFFDILPEAGDW